jgi:hypothetical protein
VRPADLFAVSGEVAVCQLCTLLGGGGNGGSSLQSLSVAKTDVVFFDFGAGWNFNSLSALCAPLASAWDMGNGVGNGMLRVLDLSQNNLGSTGASIVASMLSNNGV